MYDSQVLRGLLRRESGRRKTAACTQDNTTEEERMSVYRQTFESSIPVLKRQKHIPWIERTTLLSCTAVLSDKSGLEHR
jgi:hypothetical protein